jgi:hypothetical protein
MYVIEYKIGLFWDHLECSNIIPYISAYYDDSSLESALKFMKKYDTYEKLKAIMIEKEKIIKEKEDEYRNKYKKIYINGKK